MTEHEDTSQSGLTIVTALGREFERVLERDRGSSRLRRQFHRRTSGMLVLGFACAIAAAAAAGAATGALDVGSVIPGGEPSGPPENQLPVEQRVLATGTAPMAGPWKVTTYKSQGIVVDGEVLEQPGSSCIRLVLSNPPARTPLAATGFCGEPANGGFDIADLPVRDSAGNVEVLLFGHAPSDAVGVVLSADNGKSIRASTLPGPANLGSDVWAMAVPVDVPNARVSWLHADGTRGGADLDLDALRILDRGQRLARGAWGVRAAPPSETVEK